MILGNDWGHKRTFSLYEMASEENVAKNPTEGRLPY